MTTLILGKGEIGEALGKVLVQYNPEYADPEKKIFPVSKQFDIIHVCFRWDDKFIEEVKKYQEQFKPQYTLVHSTVPPGICKQLGAISSPVVGQHPFLYEGLKTFSKMISGKQASQVADYFRRAGLKVILFDKPETTEAAKLFLTEYYRVCIEFTKRVKRYCDKNNLNFSEVYRIPNQVYNSGYKALGHDEFIRPILEPIMTEKLGGHCVGQNEELINLTE